MKIDKIKEFLSACPIMNRGQELIEVIYLRARELGVEKEIICKISSNVLPILALTPGFTMNIDVQVDPEYICGTYNNITFIMSAYLNNSIDILEN